MFDLIQDILLSQYLLVLILVALLVMVTSWAKRDKEYAGYVLGWLVGILLIIMFQTLTRGDSTPEPVQNLEGTPEEAELTLSFMTVTVTSIFGIIVGYSILFFMNTLNMSRRRRSMTIAIFTTLLVWSLYLVFNLSTKSSQTLGIFALAFAIGALFNMVLNKTRVPTRFQAEALAQQTQSMPYDPLDDPPPANLRTQRQRFDKIRRQNRPPGS